MLLVGRSLSNNWIWRYFLGKLQCEWSANRQKKEGIKRYGKRTVLDEEADLRKWFCLLVLCLASSERQSSLQPGLLHSWVWTFSVELSFFCRSSLLPEDLPPLLGHPFSCTLLTKYALQPYHWCFAFTKRGGCKIKVEDLVMELKSKVYSGFLFLFFPQLQW